MAVRKRDFQKVAHIIQEFIGKLACEEATAELRDTLKLTLLYLQKYYKILRSRSSNFLQNSMCRSLGGSLILNGGISPVSPACSHSDHFEWKWYNLESPRLTATLGSEELSPVLRVAKSGDHELLKDLIENDPEVVTEVDALGRNAVMYAVHGNTETHIACLEVLLGSECDVNHQANDNSSALHVAAHDNNSSALELLLKNKASCNVEDNEGRIPLHWAAANSSVGNMKLLLQHGAKINVMDGEGLTPAMWACQFDQSTNLILLQTALARINPRDEALFEDTDIHGQTVIHWAVNKTGSIECLKVLLTGETAMLCDNEGKTVLHVAAEQGNVAACDLVLSVQGISGLHNTDREQRTPLHLAALCAQGEAINYLLDKGADLSASDASGATPLEYITSKQLHYCCKVFTSHPRYCKEEPAAWAISEKTNHPEMSGYDDQAIQRDPAGEETAQLRSTPSAPPTEVLLEQTSDGCVNCEKYGESVFSGDHKMDVSDIHGFEVQDGFELDSRVSDSYDRRHSAPSRRQAEERPTPSVHTYSAPPSMPKVQDDTNSDNHYDKPADNQHTTKRQNTLMRQHGFQNTEKDESSHTKERLHHAAASIDLRTEDGDGDMLVVVTNPRDIENPLHLQDSDMEISCHDEHVERFERPDSRMDRESTYSVHSDADEDADNCSVSVALSVSSLGNDDEIIIEEERDCYSGEEDIITMVSKKDKTCGQQQPDGPPQHVAHNNVNQPKFQPTSQVQAELQCTTRNEQQFNTQQQKSKANPQNSHTSPGQEILETAKKRKDKTKRKKKKVATVVELPAPLAPPRGFVAPLGPPGQFGLGAKLGAPALKPGPWQHAGFGPLRGVPPGPQPPDLYNRNRSCESDFVDIEDEIDNRAYARPGTPEPPRSPRDPPGQSFCQPSFPGMGANMQGVPLRGPKEIGVSDRDAFYGLQGASHGPLAHATGQMLLRKTDMMQRGQMNKVDARQGVGMGGLPRGHAVHPGYQTQQMFPPRAPGPHPPPSTR